MPRRVARSEAGTEPGTKDRNNHEERRAGHESGGRGDAASDKITREQAREQRVRCQDKNNREQVGADDDGDGFEHRLSLRVRRETTNRSSLKSMVRNHASADVPACRRCASARRRGRSLEENPTSEKRESQ